MWYKIGILVAVNVFFYFRTIWYGLIIDDVAAYNQRERVVTKSFWKNLWLQFRQQYIGSIKLAHFFSFMMHMINCVLILLLFGNNDVSLLAALFFALNPVNNQGSLWLSGRPYSVATALILMGLILTPLFPIFYMLGFCWSVSSFMAPLLFLIIGPKWVALLVPLTALLLRRKFLPTMRLRAKTVTPVMKERSLRKLILVVKTITYYFIVCLFPVRLGMCHSYLHSFGLSEEETKPWFKIDKFFVMGIILMVLSVYLSIQLGAMAMLGLLWFYIFIFQWSNFITINHPICERYAYLANVGLMLFLAQLTVHTPIAYLFIAFYATRNWLFTPVYKNCLEYWKSNTENFPDVAMGYNQYGLELQHTKYYGTAFDIWLRGLKVRKQDFRLNFNISNLLANQKRFDIIKEFVLRAEKNLDKNNNYELWRGHIDRIKAFCKENGLNLEGEQHGNDIQKSKIGSTKKSD